MADSQLILELLFLQRRGGCSLTVLLFFPMLVGTCCFILSNSHAKFATNTEPSSSGTVVELWYF